MKHRLCGISVKNVHTKSNHEETIRLVQIDRQYAKQLAWTPQKCQSHENQIIKENG